MKGLANVVWSNPNIHAEEWDVVLWRYAVGWLPLGQEAHVEYRWHCTGHRWAGRWSLHLAQAFQKEPELDRVGSAQMVAALKQALEKALGMPVRPFNASSILWAEEDRPAYLPCPFRHGAGMGYAPTQLALLKARSWA